MKTGGGELDGQVGDSNGAVTHRRRHTNSASFQCSLGPKSWVRWGLVSKWKWGRTG